MENDQSSGVQLENDQSSGVQVENNQSSGVQLENDQSSGVQSSGVQVENNQSSGVDDGVGGHDILQCYTGDRRVIITVDDMLDQRVWNSTLRCGIPCCDSRDMVLQEELYSYCNRPRRTVLEVTSNV